MNTIRMTTKQFSKLRKNLLAGDAEASVFLLAGIFHNDTGTHFAVRDVLVLNDEDYDHQSKYRLQASPIFFNKAISLAEANEVAIIQCHSHPFSGMELGYSITDNIGESRSAQTIQNCLGVPMGSLLFGPKKIVGRIWLSLNQDPQKIDQLRLVDRHLKIKDIRINQNNIIIDKDVFDREIRAFGVKGQQLLSQIKVGIVGLGGTGSAVAEELARAGIRNYLIMDNDRFEKTNKTKLYGSYDADTNQYKTKIIKRNIKKIQPSAVVRVIKRKITTEQDLDELKNCDVIFSCTDRHTPRALLSNFVYQYLIPIIDIGVGLDAVDGKIVAGQIRATLLSPTLPCLFCIGIINPETILVESLPAEERKARQQEGYIVGIQDDVPSLVEVTTLAASIGVLLLKDLLFGVVDTQANTLTLDITTFQSSRLTASIKPDCICQKRLGLGDTKKLVVT